jgi:NAD-dependent dihydropyrimidine dehydrogenase PreA subunit
MVHGTLVGVHMKSCTGCMKCVSACPTAVIAPWTDSLGRQVVDPVNETECMACLLCEVVCPADAISIQRDPGSAETLDSLLRDA